jgi:DNA uptake protein ComE-like DNA-binding protein
VNESRQSRRISCTVTGVVLGALLAAGCQSHPSNEQIQQQAAQTTQQLKQDAQQAASNARATAAKAEDKINAVAAGVKEGLQAGSSSQHVDLNSATRNQLASLPGITASKARRIISGRPYSTPSDLVSRNILTEEQFNRIQDRVTVQSTAP